LLLSSRSSLTCSRVVALQFQRMPGEPIEFCARATGASLLRDVPREGLRVAHDPRGFLKHGRTDTPKRPAVERVRDWQPIYLRAKSEVVSEQASRCMDCGVAFCH